MARWTRRALLRGSVGIFVPLSGCPTSESGESEETVEIPTSESGTQSASLAGTSQSQTDTKTQSEAATSPPETVTQQRTVQMGQAAALDEATSVTVHRVTVRQSVTYLELADRVAIHSAPGQQLAFAAISVEGTLPAGTHWTLALDDERFDSRRRFGDASLSEIRKAESIDTPRVSGDIRILGFQVPVFAQLADATIALESEDQTIRWSIPDRTEDRLRNRPAFTVTELDVPRSLKAGESFDVSLTVTNGGSRNGTFRAIFESQATREASRQNIYTIDVQVPAGESRILVRTFEFPPPFSDLEEHDTVTWVLDWGTDQTRQTSDVVEAETKNGSQH